MFRISQYMKQLVQPTPVGVKRNPPGPVVIWNLIRRCNLACLHCYTNSYDQNFTGELNTEEVFKVMQDLKKFHVPVLILSGGEPLLRPDFFQIAERARDMGFYVGLSTNGTFIRRENIDQIQAMDFDYVGISLDGIGDTHDQFRRKKGAFTGALNGIRLCKEKGIKVGIRYTLTQENGEDFPKLLELMQIENIDKFYFSHLNYSGRGNRNRNEDAYFHKTKEAMDLLFDAAYASAIKGDGKEYVTGNNDADGVYMLKWVEKKFPEKVQHLREHLVRWGGNSTGINIANIDNLGNVHPDSFFWDYNLGNVREREFSEIWQDTSDPLMFGLKQQPRKIEGRCSKCHYFDVCNGNTRVRAFQVHKNPWAEDPGCYLDDAELGIQTDQLRENLV